MSAATPPLGDEAAAPGAPAAQACDRILDDSLSTSCLEHALAMWDAGSGLPLCTARMASTTSLPAELFGT